MAKQAWKLWHSLALAIVLVAMGVIGWFIPQDQRLWIWLAFLALLTVFAIIVGQGITGLFRGVLIDDRFRMSLSRLQMTIWTILVLSAFLAAGISNLRASGADPLGIDIPPELWALIGISTTTLVGSPLLRSTKSRFEPDLEEKAKTFDIMAQQTDVPKDSLNNAGQVVTFGKPADSQWSDLFKGEETGNGATLDLAKLQMFFFTVIIVMTYGFALGDLFDKGGLITAFPGLDAGLVALLGISHAGYLANKVVPHSTEGDQEDAPASGTAAASPA